jgi:hypothetical protein
VVDLLRQSASSIQSISQMLQNSSLSISSLDGSDSLSVVSLLLISSGYPREQNNTHSYPVNVIAI